MNHEVQTIHEYIRLEAYLLSERAGHPAGMDQIFWTQAEAIVHGRSAVVSGTGEAVLPKAKTRAAKPKHAPKATLTVKAPKELTTKKTTTKKSAPSLQGELLSAPDASVAPAKAKSASPRKRAK